MPARDPLADISGKELYERGLERKQGGQFVSAEQYFTAAIGKGYPREKVLRDLLDVCIASSRYQTALQYAREHLADHPKDWKLRYVIATLHVAVGHDGEAEHELQRIVGSKPEMPGPHHSLAVLFAEKHEDDLAEHHYRRYLELEPDGRHAVDARAWLRARETRQQVSDKASK